MTYCLSITSVTHKARGTNWGAPWFPGTSDAASIKASMTLCGKTIKKLCTAHCKSITMLTADEKAHTGSKLYLYTYTCISSVTGECTYERYLNSKSHGTNILTKFRMSLNYLHDLPIETDKYIRHKIPRASVQC